jgi:hypothetical protein
MAFTTKPKWHTVVFLLLTAMVQHVHKQFKFMALRPVSVCQMISRCECLIDSDRSLESRDPPVSLSIQPHYR